MDTNTATASVFAAFIEADKALKELPSVKADLEAAHGLIDEAHAEIEAKAKAIADATARIAQLEADLAAREAALADATKSRDEASNLLSGLRGLLGVSVPHAPEVTHETVVNPTNPAPSIAPEPSVNGEQHGADAHTASAASFEAVANTSAMPNDSTFPADIRDSHTELTAGQGATDPTMMAKVESTTEPSHGTDLISTADSAPNPTEVPVTPIESLPYRRKPSDMTWGAWSALGHNVPFWITDMTATD